MNANVTVSGSTTLKTRTGFAFSVRTVTPADVAALAEFFDAVSVEDLRFRFLSSLRHVRIDQILSMVAVDHKTTENFLAFDEQDELIAAAMLASDGSLDVAEVAMAIRADHKGRGIGWTLLEYVTREARKRGIKRLQSIESRDNHSAIELEREMGFTATVSDDDPSMIILETRC